MLLFIKAVAGGVAAAIVAWVAIVAIDYTLHMRAAGASHPGALVAVAGGWDYFGNVLVCSCLARLRLRNRLLWGGSLGGNYESESHATPSIIMELAVGPGDRCLLVYAGFAGLSGWVEESPNSEEQRAG